MTIGMKTLLMMWSSVSLIVCIGALWSAAAIMSIDALTEAREDQLLSATQQTAVHVLAYFQEASIAAGQVAEIYNASTYKYPSAPEMIMLAEYFNGLQTIFDAKSTIENVVIIRPRDRTLVDSMPAADQKCDMDGFLFNERGCIMFNGDTVGNPANCSSAGNPLAACVEGSARFMLNGATAGVVGDPGKPTSVSTGTVSCDVVGSTDNFEWADRQVWESGVFGVRWAQEIEATDEGLRKQVEFGVRGDDYAPLGTRAVLSQRLTPLVADAGGEITTLFGILTDAAEASTYNEVLFLLSSQRQLLATSDPSAAINDRTEPRVVVATDSSVDGSIADISRELIGQYCPSTPCDWSGAQGLQRIGSSIVALEHLDDANAAGLNILLVSFVKRSEVLQPATDLNVNISILACSMLVVLCAASVAMAHLLASSVRGFSHRLLSASAMLDLDAVNNNQQKRFVYEVNVMQTALNVLVAQLLEYKTFLPAGMFDDHESDNAHANDDDTHQETMTVTTDTRSRKSATSKNGAKEPITTVHTGRALRTRTVTVFCTNIRGWTAFIVGKGTDDGRIGEEHRLYISTLVGALSPSGNIDRFNGDRVLASFGTVNACTSSSACKVAFSAMQLLQLQPDALWNNGFGGGLSKGRLIVGIGGDKLSRAFNLIGSPINVAWKLADVATSLSAKNGCELLIDAALYKEVEKEFEGFCACLLNVGKKFPWMQEAQVKVPVYLALQLRSGKNEEWMYQVESTGARGDTALEQILDNVFASDLDEEVYESTRNTLRSLLHAAGKPNLAEHLAGGYSEFRANASHTL
ncbi:hypothetical protein DIPPA_08151 [Diplonema papillatum]|nr:hypothetical protein DIPPA_08151 [Diplonema papillatum]